ncbi:MAG: DUF2220 family protein [Bifidobacteriaceae bacterium]|jgi:hypothetical protein|nr:DUF2220 family protein [Bifidobacteriaceae bacterium]
MAERMVTPQQAAARMRASYDRNCATWAVGQAQDPQGAPNPRPPAISLGPPSEAEVLADQEAAARWVRSWDDPAVEWERRRWANLGSQAVPVRLIASSPAEAARLAGRSAHWRAVSQRVGALGRRWGLADRPPDDPLAAALRRHARALGAVPAEDFERIGGVIEWLEAHPDSGLYVRQLPIRGIDSKWIEHHSALVRDLLTAVTGRDTLGLAKPPVRLRLRILDPDLAPGCPPDVEAPVDHVAALNLKPGRVIVLENLQTLLALPPAPGVVAVFGGGYAVAALDAVPWLREAPITYWGDLDSHGFAIVNRLRSHVPAVHTVLMDTATLDAYRDLAVPEPKPTAAGLPLLSPPEEAAYHAVTSAGLRLEQERLPWGVALAALGLD